MKTTLILLFCLLAHNIHAQPGSTIIANGHMPNIARDKANHIHVVYGTGDSIMYISSIDGKDFSSPELVAVLPKLFASAMRGPQIAVGDNGIIITACTSDGNIFSYRREAPGKWTKPIKVNDVDESAKEALMGLSADGLSVYAVWLAVKSPKGQHVYGARSVDGGKTWQKNVLVYKSPDGTVCECCKPSVAVEGNRVYVMFRNWLKGGRDLYLTRSSNGGKTFERVQKLGNGTWKLKGCPMDGGGFVINKQGTPQTVWRREGKIYASTPGAPETELGEGKSCSMESIGDRKMYAWTESGNVIVLKNSGERINLGKGSLPLIKAMNDDHLICIYESDSQIRASLLSL